MQAAKETGALQAAKEKLEEEVQELNYCLEKEKRMRVIHLFAVDQNVKHEIKFLCAFPRGFLVLLCTFLLSIKFFIQLKKRKESFFSCILWSLATFMFSKIPCQCLQKLNCFIFLHKHHTT